MADDLVPFADPIPDQQIDLMVDVWQRSESPWLPQSLNEAEWAARKLAEAREAYDVLLAEVDEYRRKVEAWARAKTTTGYGAALAKRVEFFEDRLRLYGLMERELSPRGRDGEPMLKTVELPSATIHTVNRVVHKAKPGQIVVDDLAVVLSWAEHNAPGWLIMSVDMNRVRIDVVTNEESELVVHAESGEVIPGVHYVPGTDAEREVRATVEVRQI